MLATIAGRIMGAAGLMALCLYGAISWFVPDTAAAAWIGAFAAVGLAAWIYLDWAGLARFFGSRGGREQIVSFVLVLFVAGICGLALHVIDRKPKRWDLTQGRIHSLDARTEQVLMDVPEDLDVSVTGFYVAGFDPSETARRRSFERLVEAARATGTRARFELLDPEASPLAASREGITSNGTVIVRAARQGEPADAGRTERLYGPDEEDLVNALTRVIANRRSKLLFVTGHGERTPQTSGDLGVSLLAGHLENLGFDVGVWASLKEASIPEDATVLVLAGPKSPLDEREAGLIREWVEKGGALAVFAEPTMPGQARVPTGLEGALLSWGLRLSDDLVLDALMTRLGGDLAAPIVDQFGYHEITEGFGSAVVFVTARSVAEDNALPEQATVYGLAKTGESAWGETDLASETASREDQDSAPPLTLVALSELHRPGVEDSGRVLLAGDVDWISDGVVTSLGNLDFVTRSLGYLSKAEDVVKIPPREKSDETIDLSVLDTVLMIFVAALLVPGAAAATGIILWVWRKGL